MTGTDFGPWLDAARAAVRGDRGVDVPCGGCTACCTSSQFVHIGPEEHDALARVPRRLRVPAPGRPGHWVIGYDERGCCPMLVDGACSIYEHRPMACRAYDCRVFAATGVTPHDKPAIAGRAVEWRFDIGPEDRRRWAALRAAAAFLAERLPGADATKVAVLAVEVHDLFLEAPVDEAAVLARASREYHPSPDGSDVLSRYIAIQL